MMAAVETLFEQALLLPEDQRGDLAARLLRTLEPDDGDETTAADWKTAWSNEIDRRVLEVRTGTVALVDGEEVMIELRTLVDQP